LLGKNPRHLAHLRQKKLKLAIRKPHQKQASYPDKTISNFGKNNCTPVAPLTRSFSSILSMTYSLRFSPKKLPFTIEYKKTFFTNSNITFKNQLVTKYSL
jgi:hypothetical protein